MLFNSLDFLVFFAVVYLLYLRLPHRAQNLMLLAASYVFYGWWDYRFLSLILFSTVVDFAVGLRLAATEDPTRRRHWLTLSLAANLGLLGFFKYYDFFVTSLEASLAAAGIETHVLRLDLVLPVGISFYTFQTLSYTIDVYRGSLRPTHRFLDFALFVAFFPQLVAGPIERASRLLGQVIEPRRLTPEQFRDGAYLVAWGLFKKVVIADHCALIVNDVFGNHGEYGGIELLIGVYAFAFQIYGDFSGYSDIARGLAKLMGFELMLNFELPYFSQNPSEFWRRWHISLSTWLRDYLYIPLGGNRGSFLSTYRNLMATMVLGGLWHGAQWTMVLWGIYHGVLLVVHRLYSRSAMGSREILPQGLLKRVFLMAVFFQFTALGWLIFRAESVPQIADFLATIFTSPSPTHRTLEMAIQLGLLALPLIGIQILQYASDDLDVWVHVRAPWRIAIAMAFVASTLAYWILFQSALGTQKEFIYFQF